MTNCNRKMIPEIKYFWGNATISEVKNTTGFNLIDRQKLSLIDAKPEEGDQITACDLVSRQFIVQQFLTESDYNRTDNIKVIFNGVTKTNSSTWGFNSQHLGVAFGYALNSGVASNVQVLLEEYGAFISYPFDKVIGAARVIDQMHSAQPNVVTCKGMNKLFNDNEDFAYGINSSPNGDEQWFYATYHNYINLFTHNNNNGIGCDFNATKYSKPSILEETSNQAGEHVLSIVNDETCAEKNSQEWLEAVKEASADHSGVQKTLEEIGVPKTLEKIKEDYLSKYNALVDGHDPLAALVADQLKIIEDNKFTNSQLGVFSNSVLKLNNHYQHLNSLKDYNSVLINLFFTKLESSDERSNGAYKPCYRATDSSGKQIVYYVDVSKLSDDKLRNDISKQSSLDDDDDDNIAITCKTDSTCSKIGATKSFFETVVKQALIYGCMAQILTENYEELLELLVGVSE